MVTYDGTRIVNTEELGKLNKELTQTVYFLDGWITKAEAQPGIKAGTFAGGEALNLRVKTQSANLVTLLKNIRLAVVHLGEELADTIAEYDKNDDDTLFDATAFREKLASLIKVDLDGLLG